MMFAWRAHLSSLLQPRIDRGLMILLVMVLVFRFFYPYFNNPFDHLFSDPLRHWDNARYLFQDRLFAGFDPKGYQFFLGGLYAVVGENRPFFTLVIGLLSAVTGLVWYCVARELLPSRWGQVTGILLALSPASLTMFGYFMNETLLAALLGGALWASLVADRTRQTRYLVLAVLFWGLAMLTRVIVIPMAILFLLALLWRLPHRGRHAVLGVLIMAALFIPATWFTHARLNVMTPFSYGALGQTYALSRLSKIEIKINNESWWFESPSYHTKPLAPFSDFHLPRTLPYSVTVDTQRAGKDWQEIIESLQQRFTWNDWRVQIAHNMIFFFFAPSWPNAYQTGSLTQVPHLAYWQRFMWAPMVVMGLLALPWVRLVPMMWVMMAGLYGTIFLLMFQTSGVMEGRYRMPLEPVMILTSVVTVYHLWWRYRFENKMLVDQEV